MARYCSIKLYITAAAMLPIFVGSVSCTESKAPEQNQSQIKKPETAVDESEQAVIIHLKLKGGAFGSSAELANLTLLEDEIAEAIENASIGEFDGNEVGGGEYTLYMYGADADQIFGTIKPILESSPVARDGIATLRYGKADDPAARQRQITWSATQ